MSDLINNAPTSMTFQQKQHSNDRAKKKKNKKQAKKDQKSNRSISRCQRLFRRNDDEDALLGKEEKHQAMRQVVVDTRKLPHQPHENQHFLTNRISTTKYTLWSFLPKAVLVQFLRVSNIYFLVTAVLCFIPNFSPLPGYSALTPLAVVLIMSLMREAYEDMKRRTNDRLTNNLKCRVLLENSSNQSNIFDKVNTIQNLNSRDEIQSKKNLFKESTWSEVKCGDLIYVEEGEHLPSDVVILASSATNGECFVQTSTLDGERALKHKQCLVPIQTMIERNGINNLDFSIHCEAPSRNLYEFHGYIESEQLSKQGTVQLHPESKKRSINLDSKQIALRGSNLANTVWMIGVTIYTGKDTKIMLNQGQSRFKQSKIEKVVNVICIYLIIIQTILCLIMSIYSGFYTSNYAEKSKDSLKRKAEYIFYTEFNSNSQSSNSTESLDYSPTLTGVLTYGQYYILLNTLIPISLVVSLEFVKLIQTPFIANDLKIYDEVQMKQAQPVSMVLHEEMASIKYIFADKTGTLTANIMQFKACTIGSVCYDEDYKEDDYEYLIDNESTQGRELRGQEKEEDEEEKEGNERDRTPRRPRETMNENQDQDGEAKLKDFEQYKIDKSPIFNEAGKESKMNRRNSITKIMWNYTTEAAQIIRNLLEARKYFVNDEINLGRSQTFGYDLILKKQNEYLHQFWMNIILCHDVIATHKKDDARPLAYQGSSPDEITLLDAAKEVGYIFFDRTSESMFVDIFGRQKQFRLLQKIEFSSDRKKMSVIVKDEETGLIILYCKGADLAIFDRLSTQIEQHFLEATKEDLIKFSTKGFRTLCFAMRVIDEDYFNQWQLKYETAKLDSMKLGLSKQKKAGLEENSIQKLQHEIESELFLIGATALEDKLQDGVPEAIEDFHSAGIKVWMLTGDKLETAENIGFSSKMFNEKMYIFKLQTNDKASTRNRLTQIDMKIQDIEKKHQTPIIGTQFILNPNAASDFGIHTFGMNPQNSQNNDYEAKNIIRALEEFKHESKASEYTLNESWARKPALRRKVRKRLEEIVPDKNAIVERLIRENQLFYRRDDTQLQSASSAKAKDSSTHDVIDNEDSFGILVEGQTLQFIMDSESMKSKFLKILAKCEAVIVCRASPSQKGLVVQMIKDNEPDSVTLAIGDGGNDVNMIQRAHVGIGIFGKEGYQAASNADYAIGQFRFLRRLLFVHGRWSGVRLSQFMLFFFNKNIVFTLPQFWFGWYCGFSGQSFFDDSYLTMFNTIVTAVAVCTIAAWDQDLNFEKKQDQQLIELFLPQIYKETQENELFTRRKFLAWAAVSVLQSIFVFGVPILVYNELILDEGRTQDMWACSVCTYFAMVLLHYTILCSFTKNWTLFMLGMYSLSFSLFFPFLVVTYNYLTYVLSNNPVYMRMDEIIFSNIHFWLILMVILAICSIPLIFYYQAQSLLFPTLKDLILQGEINYDEIMAEADPQKAKAAHEMFKLQQQQILMQWQMDYQNFQSNNNIIQKSAVSLNNMNNNMNNFEVLDQESPVELPHGNSNAGDIDEGYDDEKHLPQKNRTSKLKGSRIQQVNEDSLNRGMLTRKVRPGYKQGNGGGIRLVNANSKIPFKFDTREFENLQNNGQDLESARSENLLNQSLISGQSCSLNHRLRSYFQEFDNNHLKVRNVTAQSSRRHQPSKVGLIIEDNSSHIIDSQQSIDVNEQPPQMNQI